MVRGTSCNGTPCDLSNWADKGVSLVGPDGGEVADGLKGLLLLTGLGLLGYLGQVKG